MPGPPATAARRTSTKGLSATHREPIELLERSQRSSASHVHRTSIHRILGVARRRKTNDDYGGLSSSGWHFALCGYDVHTGSMKLYETKIFKAEVEGVNVAFALAGIQDYGLMAIQDCQKAILKCASKQQSIDDIQDLIRSTLKRLFEEHAEMQPDDEVQLLIGAQLARQS